MKATAEFIEAMSKPGAFGCQSSPEAWELSRADHVAWERGNLGMLSIREKRQQRQGKVLRIVRKEIPLEE